MNNIPHQQWAVFPTHRESTRKRPHLPTEVVPNSAMNWHAGNDEIQRVGTSDDIYAYVYLVSLEASHERW